MAAMKLVNREVAVECMSNHGSHVDQSPCTVECCVEGGLSAPECPAYTRVSRRFACRRRHGTLGGLGRLLGVPSSNLITLTCS